MDQTTQKPLLLIVTGLPCTGKTELAAYLAHELGLPFLHKDGIKETLFDALGWSDRARSRVLGAATYDLLYYFLDLMMQAKVSLVVESNFPTDTASSKLCDMISHYNYYAIQILCKADGEVLKQRFQARAESGSRHPGHVDAMSYAEIEPRLQIGRLDPLNIDGPLLEIDTSDFDTVDYKQILQSIQETISHQKETTKHP